jgi:hypothetical protein
MMIATQFILNLCKTQCLRKSKPFRTHCDGCQQRRPQLFVRFVLGQVDLIEAGMTLREPSLVTKVSDDSKLCRAYS